MADAVHLPPPALGSRRRIARLLLLAIFGINLAIGAIVGGLGGLDSEIAHATHCGTSNQSRRYVAQFSTQGAYGIDGYIGHGTGFIFDTQCNKVARFFNVQSNNSVEGHWLQIGVRIGIKDYYTHAYDASNQVYSESETGCWSYSRMVFGSPTTTNNAYYIARTPNYTTACGATYYEYQMRRDTWSSDPYSTINPPINLAYQAFAGVQWSAQVEVGSHRSPAVYEWPGTVTFGNPSWSLGHGMAWYNLTNNTWNEWSSSVGGVGYADAGLSYCQQVAYRAVSAKQGSC